MENSLKNNFSLEQRDIQLQTEGTLAQSFWLGKSLQTAYKTGELSSALEEELDKVYTKNSETSLSQNVHQLICESFQQLDAAIRINGIQNQEDTFTEAGHLIWGKIREVLGEDIINNHSNCDYHDAVRRLHPVCHAIHQELISLSQQEFEQRYKANLQWTGYDTRFLDCFPLLNSSNTADHNLCLLHLTSSLEHALGNVHLSYACTSQCPSLLKDLLATRELKEVFGDTVVSLLHILIGPPSSLNLRNVLWHGFAAPAEVPVQYASLLLVITASMSSKLKDAPFCSREIKRRPLVNLSTCADDNLYRIFPPLQLSNMQEISKFFHSSFFIIPSMLPLWILALEYFKQQRFDFCVIQLLPQLENGLRRVFACVNNCLHRVLTAESTVLYTTFDEILSPVLQDGSENLLRQEIGDSHLEMLLDILVHSEGPRIRDHISHGEVDLREISQQLANHILCICVAFAGLYIYPEHKHGNYDSAFPLVERICETAKAYKSLFHPISLLAKTLQKLALSLLKWQDLPKPFGEEFDSLEGYSGKPSVKFPDVEKALQLLMTSVSSSTDNLFKVSQWNFDFNQIDTFVQGCVEILDAAPCLTLFRPKGEIEVALLLRSIAQHGKVISEQICEAATVRYQQWQDRQLRQRQRANYKRLWSHLPSMFATLQLMVVVVIAELISLPTSGEQRHRSIFIKFLKRCLQCSENMDSLSSASKNKWDECHTVGKTFVESVGHYYAKLRQEMAS
ncbi:endoplasmic reticulum membrane-associated RNA degradation protein-like [Oculina patagonica]